MTLSLLEAALVTSMPLLAGLVATAALRRRSAAVRHWVLACAVMTAFAVPALQLLMPASAAIRVGTPGLRGGGSAARTSAAPTSAAAAPSAPVAAEFEAVAASQARAGGARPAALVLDVWGIGVGVAALFLGFGLARLRWLASRAHELHEGAWCDALDEASAAVGLSRPVRLLQSDHAWLLVTWGYWRPTVFLPSAAAEWPRGRIRVVLTHELAHVVRGDWVSQLVAEAVRVVAWFNPIAWLTARQLRIESERACDDLALACGVRAEDFAVELVSLARTLRQPRRSALPAPAMARPSSLEGRIHAMLNTTLDRRPPSTRLRVIVAACLAAVALPAAAIRAQAFYTLSGRVTDPTDRLLPHATLVLTNESNGAIYQIESDARGQYQFVGLPSSTYALKATVTGFETLNVTDIAMSGDAQRDLRMSVGSLEETVTVSASSPAAPPGQTVDADRAAQAAARIQKAEAVCAASGSDVGGRILPPVPLAHTAPVYPDAAKAAGIGGTVTMEALIGEDGFIQDIQSVAGGTPDLQRAASDAIRQWQFSTTLLNCQPTAVRIKVTVHFTPPR